METLEAIDQGISHGLRHAQRPWLTPQMQTLGWLGHPLVLLGILVFAILFFWLIKDLRSTRLLVILGLVAYALCYGLQFVVGRERPALQWALETHPMTPSFPSDQALLATAILGTLALVVTKRPHLRKLQRLSMLTVAVLVFLIGFSRLYVGVNYLSDVLTGWVAGLLLVLIANRFIPEPTAPPG